MSDIRIVKGDATEPVGSGVKVIAHICNDVGAWGAGFVMALSAKDRGPERDYRRWFNRRHLAKRWPAMFQRFELGMIQQPLSPFAEDVFVCNMIAQHGTCEDERGRPPIRYAYLMQCLHRLRVQALQLDATVHMPRIGCGLAGGNWDYVSQIIEHTLINYGIGVTVYDFETPNLYLESSADRCGSNLLGDTHSAS